MIGDHLWERLPAATHHEERRRRWSCPGRRARRPAPRTALDADQIEVPALIARGERCAPQRTGGHVARQAVRVAGSAGPAELVVVAGAAHGIHFQDPAAMAQLVRRLAAAVTAG